MNDLPKSLAFIKDRLSELKSLKPSDVINAIKESNVQAEDLMPWADFQHPTADSYGRKLVYKAPNFEIMVMSWLPGDFSTIHDHGYTTWGAVKVFGPNEHATFRVEDDKIYTLTRTDFESGQIVGVGHNLIHQMGNPTKENILTLHIYGLEEEKTNVTGDARLYELDSNTIQIINGGVFFDLPADQIAETIAGPKGDFPTQLRHLVELAKRMQTSGQPQEKIAAIKSRISSADALQELHQYIETITDSEDHSIDSSQWNILNREMKVTASFLAEKEDKEDLFHKYAELYDALICQPCFDNFIEGYLTFFVNNFVKDVREKQIISLGCGTGLVEEQMMTKFGVAKSHVYGIDFSAAMVEEAKKRINADVGDILTLDPLVKKWDIAFSGLNVYQYLDSERLEEAIEKTAGIVKDGGYFVGDFITPDHIRWYPNVMFSPDKKIISLRTPKLIEKEGKMFQESEIINIDYGRETLSVNYAGKHKRFLVPLHRVRSYFEAHFKGEVKLFDALSLKEISASDDTCLSTRYFVVARKG